MQKVKKFHGYKYLPSRVIKQNLLGGQICPPPTKIGLNVQAVCDFSTKFITKFIDVVVQWPGSVHDARIFSNSMVFKKLKNGTIPQNPKVIIDGEDPVPICLLGDPAGLV